MLATLATLTSMQWLSAASDSVIHAASQHWGPGGQPSKTKQIWYQGALKYKVPSYVVGGTTYMPIWYVMQVLKQAGVENTWDGHVWDFVKGQPFHVNSSPQTTTSQKNNSTHKVDPSYKTIVVNGKAFVTVPSFVLSRTTFMPIWYVMRALRSIGYNSTWNGVKWSIMVMPAGKASGSDVDGDPHSSGSGAAKTGGGLSGVTSSPSPANGTGSSTGPAGSGSSSGTGQAGGAPSGSSSQSGQTASGTSAASGASAVGGTSLPLYWFTTSYAGHTKALPTLAAHLASVQGVFVFSVNMQDDGSVSSQYPVDVFQVARSANVPVYLTVSNLGTSKFDGWGAAGVLANPVLSAKLVANITSLVVASGAVGVNMDVEALPASARSNYDGFLSQLAASLHAHHKLLSVDVPAESHVPQAGAYNGAYDYSSIGKSADSVMLMAYDYSYPGSAPGPISPVWWVNQVLSYATQVIDPNKVLLGIATYGYDWSSAGTKARTMSSIDRQLAALHITPQWDATDEVPYYTYTDSLGQHQVYYEDGKSYEALRSLAQRYKVAGVAVWRLGLEDPSAWSVFTPASSGKTGSN